MMIKDIHTHRKAPYPEGIVNINPENISSITNEGQLYSVGFHPWELTSCEDESIALDAIQAAATIPFVAAIGEAGIDIMKGGPLYRQMLVFKEQALIAEAVGKPLIIHCVKAQEQIIGLYNDIKPSQKWIIHGFRGKPSVAKMFINAGICLSFGEHFNADTLLEVPEDMVFAETDESTLSIDEIIAQFNEIRHGIGEAMVHNALIFRI